MITFVTGKAKNAFCFAGKPDYLPPRPFIRQVLVEAVSKRMKISLETIFSPLAYKIIVSL
jgi:hypothetical protein